MNEHDTTSSTDKAEQSLGTQETIDPIVAAPASPEPSTVETLPPPVPPPVKQERRPEPTAAIAARAEQALREGRFDEALPLYLLLAEREPRKAMYRYRQGECLRGLERFAEAVESYDLALDLWPEFEWARLRRLACLLNMGREDEAIAGLDELREKLQESKEKFDRVLIAAAYRLLVDHHHAAGRLVEAIAVANLAVEHTGDDCNTWYRLGKLLHEADDASSALEAYRRAFELEPKGYIADRIARCLDRLDRYEEALAVWAELPRAERDWYVCRNEARARHRREDGEGARRCVEEGLRRRRNEPTLNYLAGVLCEERGEFSQARRHYEIAVCGSEKQYGRRHEKAAEGLERVSRIVEIDAEQRTENPEGEAPAGEQLLRGTITKFVEERGFGFITRPGAKKGLFFHISQFKDGTPVVGLEVEFRLGSNERGELAEQVRSVAKPTLAALPF